MEDINSKLAAQWWQVVIDENEKISRLKDEKIALIESRADVFNTFITDLMTRVEKIEEKLASREDRGEAVTTETMDLVQEMCERGVVNYLQPGNTFHVPLHDVDIRFVLDKLAKLDGVKWLPWSGDPLGQRTFKIEGAE